MADDKDDLKKLSLGPQFFPKIWIWICATVNMIGMLAMLMLIIAEFVILINNYQSYVMRYGYKYPSRGYGGEAGSGYVEYTNAPKHVGSQVFVLFYQLSIMVLATLAIASDLAWRTASYNAYGGRYVQAFFAGGILEGTHNTTFFFYVVANGFLKLFIVVLYMSQSFYGLSGGTHSDPLRNRTQYYYLTGAPAPYYPSGNHGSATATGTATVSWRRAYYDGQAGDRMRSSGTELWALWTGWIVLGSVLPSIIAFMFLVPYAVKYNSGEKGEGGGKGGDAEKGTEAPKPADPAPKSEKSTETSEERAARRARDRAAYEARKAAEAAGS